MLHRELYFTLTIALAVFIVVVAGAMTNDRDASYLSSKHISDLFDPAKMKEHYPLGWLDIPYKPVVDNARLFKKYKDCLLYKNISGCPNIMKGINRLAPEIVVTNCKKCLPEHITLLKGLVEYICRKRKDEWEEIKRVRDPNGVILGRFQEKYNIKFDC